MPIKLKIDKLIEQAQHCGVEIKTNQKHIFMLRSEFCTVEHNHNDDTRFISECSINDISKLNRDLVNNIPANYEGLKTVSTDISKEAINNRQLQEDIYILTNRITEVEAQIGVIYNLLSSYL